jgi:hypothetical protein
MNGALDCLPDRFSSVATKAAFPARGGSAGRRRRRGFLPGSTVCPRGGHRPAGAGLSDRFCSSNVQAC